MFVLNRKSLLFNFALLILGTYFFFLGLIQAQVFLKPLVTALIFSLLAVPLANKLESWKIPRIYSSLISTLLLLVASLGFFSLVSLQVKGFLDNWDNLVKSIRPMLESLNEFLIRQQTLEIEPLDTQNIRPKIPDLSDGEGGEQFPFSFVNYALGFILDYLLTMVYIFFLLHYRRKFKEFIIRLFPGEKKEEVTAIVRKTTAVAQQYLYGKFLLIIFLALVYAVGLGISGVRNYILISILAAVFSLIPYFGNLIALGLVLALRIAAGGDMAGLFAVIVVFSVVQFIETYILEPYVIGDQVDIHPFFIIVTVILGNMVWGVMGMILAVPVVGIINVVLRNVSSLEAFGFLLSNDSKPIKRLGPGY